MAASPAPHRRIASQRERLNSPGEDIRHVLMFKPRSRCQRVQSAAFSFFTSANVLTFAELPGLQVLLHTNLLSGVRLMVKPNEKMNTQPLA